MLNLPAVFTCSVKETRFFASRRVAWGQKPRTYHNNIPCFYRISSGGKMLFQLSFPVFRTGESRLRTAGPFWHATCFHKACPTFAAVSRPVPREWFSLSRGARNYSRNGAAGFRFLPDADMTVPLFSVFLGGAVLFVPGEASPPLSKHSQLRLSTGKLRLHCRSALSSA